MELDQPLSDREFDELDGFLLSEQCPDGAMTMDYLHGYLTAIVIGPESIPMSEWLPQVWGDEGANPEYKNENQAKRIINLIARFMNEIAITFEVAPKEFEPLFCEREWEGKTVIDGEGWAFGFWEGMNMRTEAWKPIWDSPLAPLMRPFYLLGADEVEEEDLQFAENPSQRQKLALEMEANTPELYRFWLPLRKSDVATLTRQSPKIGRNDDCPCGSGKKFKKCCGQPTLH
jgi:uncharacterized protein